MALLACAEVLAGQRRDEIEGKHIVADVVQMYRALFSNGQAITPSIDSVVHLDDGADGRDDL